MRQLSVFALEVIVALALALTATLFYRFQALPLSTWLWWIVLSPLFTVIQYGFGIRVTEPIITQ
jgi:ABC-type multidrug transport system permease subunit